jgi:hypothetical protein
VKAWGCQRTNAIELANGTADCGATHVTEAQVKSSLKERLPNDSHIESMKFGGISEYVMVCERGKALNVNRQRADFAE